MRQRHLAVDIGAASARLIAGWEENGVLRMEEIHRFTTGDTFLAGRRVRNLYRWYEDVLTGFTKYTRRFGCAPDSVGVDAMGEDFVLLDEMGGFTAMPPSYRDRRDLTKVLAEEAKLGCERIYSLCGNQSVPNDTLRQLIDIKQTYPDTLKNARGLLFLADAFHYLLCGNRSVQHALANYGKLYDQKKQAYSDEIFRAFGLPYALQSPICQCGDDLGAVHPQICRDMGWENAPRVIAPASHDTACAAFAIPDEGFDYAFVSSGSWSLVGMPVNKWYLTNEAYSWNFSNSSMPYRGGMLKGLAAGMWLIQRCKAEWGAYNFSEIASLASAAQAGNLMINPDDDRFYNPPDMRREICEDVRKRCGAELDPENAGVISRLIFEGMALGYRRLLSGLHSVTGIRPKCLHIVGGGARNALMNQLAANATGLNVYTSVAEASAAGNILCQMIGMGELAGEAEAKRLIKNSFPIARFTPQDGDLWAEKYARFARTFYPEAM